MKIDKTNKPIPAVPTARAQAPVAKSTGNGVQSAATDGTHTHLGSTSAQLQSIEASMSNIPVVDAGKVAEIKQAINEGRFKVNSSAVADRLIKTVHDLINARKA